MNNDLRPEGMVGEFILKRRIGVGGAGEVWSARSIGRMGHEPIALKFLLPDIKEDSENYAAFFDEVRVARKLVHENIVRVHDLHELGRHIVLSMELVEGVSLQRLLVHSRKNQEAIPVPYCMLISLDISRGLRYAHSKCKANGGHLEIVHRDISPHNVMVTENGISKITDFGIAVFEGRFTETQSGCVKGKFGYMAPEQYHFGEATLKTDVFCAGIVFWELFANRKLFERSTQHHLQSIFAQGIPPVGQLRPTVPSPVEAVISQMLAIRSESRLESMAKVEEVLAHTIGADEEKLRDELTSWLKTTHVNARRQTLPRPDLRNTAPEPTKKMDMMAEQTASAVRDTTSTEIIATPPDARTHKDDRESG